MERSGQDYMDWGLFKWSIQRLAHQIDCLDWQNHPFRRLKKTDPHEKIVCGQLNHNP